MLCEQGLRWLRASRAASGAQAEGATAVSVNVSRQDRVAAVKSISSRSSPESGGDRLLVDFAAATRSRRAVLHGRCMRDALVERRAARVQAKGPTGLSVNVARQGRVAAAKSISSRSSPDSGDDQLLIDFAAATRA